METDKPTHLPARFIREIQRDPGEGLPGGDVPGLGHQFVPHIMTIAGRHGIASRSYLNMDEALRDSPSNAERMRADCGIMECLEARQRSTALLSWHIEPEDAKSHEQRELATAVEQILESTPRFTEMRRVLGEALWYGRYAVALQYGPKQVRGQWRTGVRRWEPRHGDKIVFRYDDGDLTHDPEQIGIRVNAAWKSIREHYDPFTGEKKQKIQPTQQGLTYWLDKWERDTVILHKHMIEDGPFLEPMMAGRINGVGIRDRIYWTWYAMIECLQRVVEYLDRAAFGIEVWPYQAGNPTHKADTENAANNAMGGGRTIILAPLPADEDPTRYLPQLIEPGLGGVNTTIDIIRTYFGHKIKRYILGQTLTSEADATGLGSGVADAHMATFADIIAYDATNLEETLTADFVRKVQLANFRGSEHIHLKLRIDTESPNIEQRMAAMKQAWDMGTRIKAQEVYDTIGAAMPDADDETLQNPQIAQAAQAAAMEQGISPQQPVRPTMLDIEGMHQSVMRNLESGNVPAAGRRSTQ